MFFSLFREIRCQDIHKIGQNGRLEKMSVFGEMKPKSYKKQYICINQLEPELQKVDFKLINKRKGKH
jgi:hypothetical protein